MSDPDELRAFAQATPGAEYKPPRVEADTTDYSRPMLGDEAVPSYEAKSGAQHLQPANERVPGPRGQSVSEIESMGEVDPDEVRP